MSEEVKGLFRYEWDSKRFHRFRIETDEGIVGTVYIPLDIKPLPTKIKLEYAPKE